MCGIAGFVPGGSGSPQDLRAMIGQIQHRGPDDSGTYHTPEVAMGHQRLAIIDLSGGKQPRASPKGHVLVFNGEIYNYRSLRDELVSNGAALRDHSDTEVLFQLLQRFEINDALERLEGMFAFAFYHAEKKQLILARDRAGEKPLYYAVINQTLIFASEVSALLAHPALAGASLNRNDCALFLTLEYIPGERTGYDYIRSLSPAHYALYSNSKLTIHRYWTTTIFSGENEIRQTSEPERIALLDRTLEASVAEQLISDVPIGVFLSGGIDSSLVANYSRRLAPGIEAFTVKLPFESYDESAYAKTVAKHLGIKFNIIEVTPQDLHSALDLIDNRLDIPFADYSLIPSTLLCMAAKKSVTVALGGDGADELFAGYQNFHVQSYARIMKRIPTVAGSILRFLLRGLPTNTAYMNLPFKLQQLSYGFGKPEEIQNFFWMAALSPQETTQIFSSHMGNENLLLKTVESLDSTRIKQSDEEKLLQTFFQLYLPFDILTKMDRASMYNSLEVRSPFLSRRMMELAFSLDFTDKLRGTQGKYLLKRLALNYLPEDIVFRKKHGFAMPLAELMKGFLRPRFDNYFYDQQNPVYDWMDKRFVEQLWQQHCAGQANHSKKLWALYRLLALASQLQQRNNTSW